MTFIFSLRKMRDYQKAYFKTRDKALMYKSIELEEQVDKAINDYMNGDKQWTKKLKNAQESNQRL
ncbi:MAG: hypothetical protein IJP88_12140 [Synergistaceae bacterium]|nr:hypothetical protein [Synergistaceae bacterium]MBR0097927.1 hypothetical protein [Synergistaceae bacterium]